MISMDRTRSRPSVLAGMARARSVEAQLDRALKDARQALGRRSRGPRPALEPPSERGQHSVGRSPAKRDSKATRSWATEHGIEVPARGRIPAVVELQYNESRASAQTHSEPSVRGACDAALTAVPRR